MTENTNTGTGFKTSDKYKEKMRKKDKEAVKNNKIYDFIVPSEEDKNVIDNIITESETADIFI